MDKDPRHQPVPEEERVRREGELSDWLKVLTHVQEEGFEPVVIVAFHKSGHGLQAIGAPGVDDVAGLLREAAAAVSDEPSEIISMDENVTH